MTTTAECTLSIEPRHVDALLLWHWPETGFAFEQIWTQLAQLACLVADPPGLAHSERRIVTRAQRVAHRCVPLARLARAVARP